MRPTSPQFQASLRSSHVIAAACQLFFPDDPSTPVNVPVEAGSATIDRTAQNRRVATVQIPWSLAAGEDLGVDLRDLTLGGYALVSRGLRYADGSRRARRPGQAQGRVGHLGHAGRRRHRSSSPTA